MAHVSISKALFALATVAALLVVGSACSSSADGVIFKCTQKASCTDGDKSTPVPDICEADSNSAGDIEKKGSGTACGALLDAGVCTACSWSCSKSSDACKQN